MGFLNESTTNSRVSRYSIRTCRTSSGQHRGRYACPRRECLCRRGLRNSGRAPRHSARHRALAAEYLGARFHPLLDTFDFAPLRERWGHWFLICGNHSVESAVFVRYGAGFAQLLGLARKPVTDLPCIEQVPVPYRAMFSAGYNRAGSASSPVTLDGTFRFEKRVELYRAVFMPIMLQPNWSKQLIFGSFNRREVGAG